MESVKRKINKIHKKANETLDHLQAQAWAEPLGQTLTVSSKICQSFGDFVPGFNLLAGALSLGGTLLSPEPTMKDLQNQLQELKEMQTRCTNEDIKASFEKRMEKMEKKLKENPPSEIREDFDNIRKEIKVVCEDIHSHHLIIQNDLMEIKHMIAQTLDLLIEVRYKEGFERVEATYDAFLKMRRIDDFQGYIAELRVNATLSFQPENVAKYLQLLMQRHGVESCRVTMHYLIVVLTKYLQLLIYYYVYREDTDAVLLSFQNFNEDLDKIVQVYEEVTKEKFTAGQMKVKSSSRHQDH